MQDGQRDVDPRIVGHIQGQHGVVRSFLRRLWDGPVVVVDHHADTQRFDLNVLFPDVVVHPGGAVVEFADRVGGVDGQTKAMRSRRGELMEDGIRVQSTGGQAVSTCGSQGLAGCEVLKQHVKPCRAGGPLIHPSHADGDQVVSEGFGGRGDDAAVEHHQIGLRRWRGDSGHHQGKPLGGALLVVDTDRPSFERVGQASGIDADAFHVVDRVRGTARGRMPVGKHIAEVRLTVRPLKGDVKVIDEARLVLGRVGAAGFIRPGQRDVHAVTGVEVKRIEQRIAWVQRRGVVDKGVQRCGPVHRHNGSLQVDLTPPLECIGDVGGVHVFGTVDEDGLDQGAAG